MGYRIIVDSSSDMPKELIERYNFKIIPLSVHFGDEEYLDAINITPSEFYDKLQKSDVMPHTSQIPPERFMDYIRPELEADNEVIIVTLGSNASGTCQSAHLAMNELGSDKVTVIDSNCLCLGTSHVAIAVAELLEAGTKPQELEEALKDLTDNGVQSLFCVDTLEFLRKGGRIKASQAVIGEILKVKPILEVNDAITETIGKVRGKKKIFPFFLDKMAENCDFDYPRILVGHAQDPKGIERLIEAIREKFDYKGDIITAEIGATIGTHAGPGVLAVFYKKK